MPGRVRSHFPPSLLRHGVKQRRPPLERIFRPIAKELIKGGIVVADSVSEFSSETGEKFKDLLAEAKSELEMSRIQGQESNKTVAGTMAKG